MLPDEPFARLVADDVKNKVSASQAEYLRLPENWERWREHLQALLRNLGIQLQELADRERSEIGRYETLGADGVRLMAEIQTEIEDRRRKIGRFRFYVESRLDEVERLIAISSEDPAERERSIDLVRSAIMRHREIIIGHDFDYSNVDEALWATLEGKWLFDDLVLD